MWEKKIEKKTSRRIEALDGRNMCRQRRVRNKELRFQDKRKMKNRRRGKFEDEEMKEGKKGGENELKLKG